MIVISLSFLSLPMILGLKMKSVKKVLLNIFINLPNIIFKKELVKDYFSKKYIPLAEE